MSLEEAPGAAFLYWYGTLWQLLPEGYRHGPKVLPSTMVEVLTPNSTVDALKSCYQPIVALDKTNSPIFPARLIAIFLL